MNGKPKVAAGQQLSHTVESRSRRGPASLRLSIATSSNPRTWPILDGTARPAAIELAATALHPSEIFYRQLEFAEFDVSEMSISSFMMAIANGDERFIGLPIFTTHHFFHTWPLVRKDAGIEGPKDLRGKRVGVPEYQQTGALWARGALQHEWGVRAQDIQWWMERDLDRVSHAKTTGFAPPPDVEIRQIPPEKNIGSMMVSGELDATLLYIVSENLVDRSTIDLWQHPEVGPLFEDCWAEGARYHEKTGIYPINHCVVIKRQLAETHPWVIPSLLDAFGEANDIADRRRLQHIEHHIELGLLPASAREALGTRVVGHGMAANRHVLEAAALYSHEQRLTRRRVRIEELFAASTLET